jgi:hypothetical protein
MKSTINLNNLAGLPPKYIKRLNALKEVFIDNEFMESFKNNSKVSYLIEEIDDYCLNNRIIGFHYTRAIANEIAANGLTCRTGKEIRATFLKKYSNLFTEQELELILNQWDRNFDERGEKTRDSRLYFNFTTYALKNFGAEPLLSNYGGEQVYMPIQDLEGISAKIKNIGVPLILKCSLDPKNIRTFYDYPWGQIAVSTFHCMVNPNAYRDDQDGSQFVNVKASDIEIVYFDGQQDYRKL